MNADQANMVETLLRLRGQDGRIISRLRLARAGLFALLAANVGGWWAAACAIGGCP